MPSQVYFSIKVALIQYLIRYQTMEIKYSSGEFFLLFHEKCINIIVQKQNAEAYSDVAFIFVDQGATRGLWNVCNDEVGREECYIQFRSSLCLDP